MTDITNMIPNMVAQLIANLQKWDARIQQSITEGNTVGLIGADGDKIVSCIYDVFMVTATNLYQKKLIIQVIKLEGAWNDAINAEHLFITAFAVYWKRYFKEMTPAQFQKEMEVQLTQHDTQYGSMYVTHPPPATVPVLENP